MALFQPKRRASGGTPPGSTLSIIASGMQVTGDIRCTGVLRIDGTLEGAILGARQLLVTPGGRVRGDVQADEIVVGGTIDGNIRASVRLELQGTAVVNGNIETRAFVVPEGGRVNGDIRMISGDDLPRTEPRLLPSPRMATSSISPPAQAPESAIPEVVIEEVIEDVIDEPLDRATAETIHAPVDEETREPGVEQWIEEPARRLSKRERRRMKKGR